MLGRLFSQASEKWPLVLQAYNHVRQPLGNKIQRSAREQGLYYDLNAPGFENITAMGQDLTSDQISIMCHTFTENWSWREDDVDEDLKQGVEFLNAGFERVI